MVDIETKIPRQEELILATVKGERVTSLPEERLQDNLRTNKKETVLFEHVGNAAGSTQQEMAQDALNRWWWPSLMMFGPHDADSAHSSKAMKWKIKRETNSKKTKFLLKEVYPTLVCNLFSIYT